MIDSSMWLRQLSVGSSRRLRSIRCCHVTHSGSSCTSTVHPNADVGGCQDMYISISGKACCCQSDPVIADAVGSARVQASERHRNSACSTRSWTISTKSRCCSPSWPPSSCGSCCCGKEARAVLAWTWSSSGRRGWRGCERSGPYPDDWRDREGFRQTAPLGHGSSAGVGAVVTDKRIRPCRGVQLASLHECIRRPLPDNFVCQCCWAGGISSSGY